MLCVERIWPVPLESKFLGGRHILSPRVMEPSEVEAALEPRDHPVSPFLMEKLRPREVE